jgi:hypothetical protein
LAGRRRRIVRWRRNRGKGEPIGALHNGMRPTAERQSLLRVSFILSFLHTGLFADADPVTAGDSLRPSLGGLWLRLLHRLQQEPCQTPRWRTALVEEPRKTRSLERFGRGRAKNRGFVRLRLAFSSLAPGWGPLERGGGQRQERGSNAPSPPPFTEGRSTTMREHTREKEDNDKGYSPERHRVSAYLDREERDEGEGREATVRRWRGARAQRLAVAAGGDNEMRSVFPFSYFPSMQVDRMDVGVGRVGLSACHLTSSSVQKLC